MECICGNRTWSIDQDELRSRIQGCQEVLLDIGTGDGRFVASQVARNPWLFGIGLDACRENLQDISRKRTRQTLFVIANALDMPAELSGQVTHLSVNFPWGSLRDGLLKGEASLIDGISRLCVKGTSIEMRLNESAVNEAGVELWEAGEHIQRSLYWAGFNITNCRALGPDELKACASTWARKMAFGRAPRGMYITGRFT